MNQDLLWRRIYANEQAVAEAEHLMAPGENYKLTASQERAISALENVFLKGDRAALLQAPTGAGKTAVEFRLAVQTFLRKGAPVVVLAPTRDLARQHAHYFASRLVGTPLKVAELHGGVAPQSRRAILEGVESGFIPILIASGLLLQEEATRQLLRGVGLLVVDDVHAFDTIEHLKPLRGIQAPTLFATATPSAVAEFLAFKGASTPAALLDTAPFAGAPTAQKIIKGRFGTDPIHQVLLADKPLRTHLGQEGRVFVVSRTRAGVPRLARFLESRFEVAVTMLHGEMVDTQEQARRLQKFKQYNPENTRVAMVEQFRHTRPAILVGTGMIGAGLDVPNADLIIITDADSFAPAEIEQLIGRVGRRDLPSEAYLIHGTLKKTYKRR